MEFKYKEHIKVVVNFDIGETIKIKGFNYKVDGNHVIEDLKPHFGFCESGILAKISDYPQYIDVGWLKKL